MNLKPNLETARRAAAKRALHSGLYASGAGRRGAGRWSFCSTWLSSALPTKYTQYDISTTSLFTLSETSREPAA